MNFSFLRNRRILKSAEFSLVFRQGKKKFNQGLVVYARLNDLGYPRLGLAVAKKHLKKAVDRNRVKRITRESFRLKPTLPPMDFVCVTTKGIVDRNNQQLFESLETIWQHYIEQYNKAS